VAVLGLNAIEIMFFLPVYPLWALVIIAALYGLCAYGSRANPHAAYWIITSLADAGTVVSAMARTTARILGAG
jgi:hypothetical protein